MQGVNVLFAPSPFRVPSGQVDARRRGMGDEPDPTT